MKDTKEETSEIIKNILSLPKAFDASRKPINIELLKL